MKDIDLGKFGVARFFKGNWEFEEPAETAIGPVFLQVLGDGFFPEGIEEKVMAVLERMKEIDGAARDYLVKEAPEDVREKGDLENPSLVFDCESGAGEFTILYDGDEPETLYGVEFEGFAPVDVVIEE